MAHSNPCQGESCNRAPPQDPQGPVVAVRLTRSSLAALKS